MLRDNLHVDEWERRPVTSLASQGCSIRVPFTEEGRRVDVILVDNGKLKFSVCPTRGMGVLSVAMGDVFLGWSSPVKEVVHPNLINLQSRGGLGWLEGFNEWMVRCGLESAGHPGVDRSSTMSGRRRPWS